MQPETWKRQAGRWQNIPRLADHDSSSNWPQLHCGYDSMTCCTSQREMSNTNRMSIMTDLVSGCCYQSSQWPARKRKSRQNAHCLHCASESQCSFRQLPVCIQLNACMVRRMRLAGRDPLDNTARMFCRSSGHHFMFKIEVLILAAMSADKGFATNSSPRAAACTLEMCVCTGVPATSSSTARTAPSRRASCPDSIAALHSHPWARPLCGRALLLAARGVTDIKPLSECAHTVIATSCIAAVRHLPLPL